VTGMLLPALALPAWLWEAAEHTASRQQA